jgi:hypothetical protein
VIYTRVVRGGAREEAGQAAHLAGCVKPDQDKAVRLLGAAARKQSTHAALLRSARARHPPGFGALPLPSLPVQFMGV